MDFQTEKIHLSIGRFQISLNTVSNIDALYDALIAKGADHQDVQDERLPYWAELWASAIGISEYLIENQLINNTTSVLEIGCGLGLPSLVAGFLGAKNVILTDYLEDALTFAKENWLLNLPLGNVNFEQMDWRQPNPAFASDILLASDVAYEKRAFEPLLTAFKTLIRAKGTIIISEPNRPVSKDFFSNLHLQGYTVKSVSKRIDRKGHTFVVNIYEIRG